jgi:hypothetical protein
MPMPIRLKPATVLQEFCYPNTGCAAAPTAGQRAFAPAPRRTVGGLGAWSVDTPAGSTTAELGGGIGAMTASTLVASFLEVSVAAGKPAGTGGVPASPTSAGFKVMSS